MESTKRYILKALHEIMYQSMFSCPKMYDRVASLLQFQASFRLTGRMFSFFSIRSKSLYLELKDLIPTQASDKEERFNTMDKLIFNLINTAHFRRRTIIIFRFAVTTSTLQPSVSLRFSNASIRIYSTKRYSAVVLLCPVSA